MVRNHMTDTTIVYEQRALPLTPTSHPGAFHLDLAAYPALVPQDLVARRDTILTYPSSSSPPKPLQWPPLYIVWSPYGSTVIASGRCRLIGWMHHASSGINHAPESQLVCVLFDDHVDGRVSRGHEPAQSNRANSQQESITRLSLFISIHFNRGWSWWMMPYGSGLCFCVVACERICPSRGRWRT